MSESLKENLKTKLKEVGMSYSDLGEKSGVKFTAIKNILNGRTQNPGAISLLALAKSLNCSVEELITGDPSATTNKHKDLPIENYKLFLAGAEKIAEFIERNNIVINQGKFIFSINEIYQYALKKKWKNIDPDFVEWYLEKGL